jgi:antitoxin component YwqK of YwqJK toxin-antitoxin module
VDNVNFTEHKLLYFQNGKLYSTQNWYKTKKHGLFTYNYTTGIDSLKETYIEGLLHNERILYYPSGKIMEKQNYSAGIKQGPVYQYYPNGTLKAELTYLRNELRGLTRYYHTNGKIESEGNTLYNKKTGVWNYYDKNGKLTRIVTYRNDKPIKTETILNNKNLKPVLIPDIETIIKSPAKKTVTIPQSKPKNEEKKLYQYIPNQPSRNTKPK